MTRHFRTTSLLASAAALVALLTLPAHADPAPIEIKDGLAIPRVSAGGRVATPTDAVQDLLVRNAFTWPKEGDELQLPGGRSTKWAKVTAGPDGWFQGPALAGGYLACAVELPANATMLLEAAGHSAAYVNGEPRGGDPYGYGYLRLPVALRAGTNHLLLAAGRGRVRAKLLPVRGPAMLDVADPTLPDVLTDDRGTLRAAVVVINTSDKPLANLRLLATPEGAAEGKETPLPAVPPLSIRKVPFDIPVPPSPQPGKVNVALKLEQAAGGQSAAADTATITLRVRKPNEVHKRTFVSRIDGSVQYYAVNPAQKPAATNALVLTLHGASVEALGQAEAYASKDWATLVAPTNRRPYGFDWEDVGRLDALEVLDLAEKTIPHDPRRVVLTGHSMGGHGAWQIGLTFPDRFAAIAPSAGWCSFTTYVGGRGQRPAATRPAGVEDILARSASPSDTLSLVRNSLAEEVYILHGDADDNVPIREARRMRDALAPFHPRLSYHEEKGAGHWWGSRCVDWPPLFAMFETARRPEPAEVRQIDFTTADPAISGRCYWATIDQQTEPMKPSTIKLRREGEKGGAITGETTNVAMLILDTKPPVGRPASVELDGQKLPMPQFGQAGPLRLVRRDGRWSFTPSVGPLRKTADRGGPFKQAFADRVQFVYGTRGTPEENAVNYAAARLHAEAFYYRGDGSVDVVADSEVDTRWDLNRNVILYGNADTNAAWDKVLRRCPVVPRRDGVTVGERRIEGADLATLLVYPRAEGFTALVGVVAGTGPAGMRAAARLPVFVSGVGLPDWMVLRADYLAKGIGGVEGAGFFGNDWSVENGETAWRQ